MGTLTEEIGLLRADVNSLKDEVTGTGDIVGLGSQIVGNTIVENTSVIISENLLDGSTLFWDDDNQGDWDDFYWSGDLDLDGYTSKTWIQVYNNNNTFEENFDLDTFIDSTTSTGTYVEPSGTVSGYYTLTDGEALISNVIAIEPSVSYTQALVKIEGSDVTDDKLFITSNGDLTGEELFLYTNQNPISGKVYDLSGNANNGTLSIDATAYYSFNGVVTDESLNSNNGTWSGSAAYTTDRFGNTNGALHLTAAPTYVDFGNDATLQITGTNITLVASVYLPSATVNRSTTRTAFINKFSSTSRGYTLDYYQGNVRFGLSQDSVSTQILPSYYISDDFLDTWLLIIGTYSSGDGKLYIGKFTDSTITQRGTTNTVITGIFNSTQNLKVNQSFENREAEYYQDETLILDKRLTSTEVDYLFEVWKSHKLDNPLVTRTDNNGDSITGYSLWGSITAGANVGSKITCPNVLGDTSSTTYLEVLCPSNIGGVGLYRLYGSTAGSRNGSVYINSNRTISLYVRQTNGTGITIDSVSLYSDNVICRIATVIDKENSVFKLYMDGVLEASSAFDGTLVTSTGTTYIGSRDSTSYLHSTMVISKPLIISSALSDGGVSVGETAGGDVAKLFDTRGYWEEVSNNTTHTFLNPDSNGIKYKVVGMGVDSTITGISINYR